MSRSRKTPLPGLSNDWNCSNRRTTILPSLRNLSIHECDSSRIISYYLDILDRSSKPALLLCSPSVLCPRPSHHEAFLPSNLEPDWYRTDRGALIAQP